MIISPEFLCCLYNDLKELGLGNKNDILGIMEVILSSQKDKSSKKVLIAYK